LLETRDRPEVKSDQICMQTVKRPNLYSKGTVGPPEKENSWVPRWVPKKRPLSAGHPVG
jgi:hypothetical protein